MRVLSIDLDYIIEPSDPLFRDWAHHNNPMVRWDAFYSTTKHKKKDLPYDSSKLKELQDEFGEAAETARTGMTGASGECAGCTAMQLVLYWLR